MKKRFARVFGLDTDHRLFAGVGKSVFIAEEMPKGNPQVQNTRGTLSYP